MTPIDQLVTERDFQTTVTKLFTTFGWLTWHAHDARRSNAGFPDLTLVHRTHGVVFAELKREKGRVRPEQTVWLDALRAAGARAFLWRPSQMDEIEAVARGLS